MDEFDLTCLNATLANSAYQFAEVGDHIEKNMEAVRRVNAEKHNAILQTAEFTKKQLEEVKKQNAKLEEANKSLNALYEQAKKDSEDSAKDAKKNRVFGWVSFVVGTFIGIAGIVLGIIF